MIQAGFLKIKQPHPTRKATPPKGVIAPSQSTFVTASKYNEPEKITMPAKKLHQGTAGKVFRSASTNSITAWMKW